MASLIEQLGGSRIVYWVATWKSGVRGHRTLFRYSAVSIFSQIANMGCNLLILRWLAPVTMGTWQSAMLILTYASLVQAGVTNGLNRELPFASGKSNDKVAADLAGTAQTATVFAIIILLLMGVPIALVLARSKLVLLCIFAALAGTASALYRNYLTVTYRAEGAFETLTKILLAETLLAVATLPIVSRYGLGGMAGRFVFLSLVGCSLNYIGRPLRHLGRFSWADLGLLLRTGTPIFIFAYLEGIVGTFPRLLLLANGGVLLVGLFAPANAIMSALFIVPASIAQYIYPRMSYQLGKSGKAIDLWPIARNTAVGAVLCSLPVAALLNCLLPFALHQWFPAYRGSEWAARWMTIAGIFVGGSIAANALCSLKSWAMMAIHTGTRLLLGLALPWICFVLLRSLGAIAFGVVISEGVTFVVGLCCIYYRTHKGSGDDQSICRKSMAPNATLA